MLHFLVVLGAVLGNFALWSVITYLPVPQMIIILLSIAVGCLMIAVMVRSGKAKVNK